MACSGGWKNHFFLWHPEPIQNGTCFLSILERKGGLGWRSANGFQSLNSVPKGTVTVYQAPIAFLMFFICSQRGPCCRMIYTLAIDSWVLGSTTFTARSGVERSGHGYGEVQGENPSSPGMALKWKLWKCTLGGKEWLGSLITGAPWNIPLQPQFDLKAVNSTPSTVFNSFLCILTFNEFQVSGNLFCDT